ncbi:hypothetical protein FRC02_010568 [Tulasnella sp. 418]|nr:hypothetical protein FRC02_010568 [Tulasnella sp. 418]
MPSKTYAYQTTTSAKLSGYLSDSQRSDNTSSVKPPPHPKLRKPKSTKDLKQQQTRHDDDPARRNATEADLTSRWVKQHLNVPPVPSMPPQPRVISQAHSSTSYSSSSTLYNSSPEDVIAYHKPFNNNHLKLDTSISDNKRHVYTSSPTQLSSPTSPIHHDQYYSSYHRPPPTAYKVTARTIITPSPKITPRSSINASPTLNVVPPPSPSSNAPTAPSLEPQKRIRSAPPARPRKQISSSGWISTRPVTVSETGSVVSYHSSTPPIQTPKFNIAGTEDEGDERDRRLSSAYGGGGIAPSITETIDTMTSTLEAKGEKGSLSAERRSGIGESANSNSMLSSPSMMMRNLLRRASNASGQPSNLEHGNGVKRSRSRSKSRGDPHDRSRPQSFVASPIQSPASPAISLIPPESLNAEKEPPSQTQKKKFDFSLPSITPLRISKAFSLSKTPKSNSVIVDSSKALPSLPSPSVPPRNAARVQNKEIRHPHMTSVGIQITTLGKKEEDVWHAVQHLRSVCLNDEDYAFCQHEDPECAYDDILMSMGIGGFGVEPKRTEIRIPYEEVPMVFNEYDEELLDFGSEIDQHDNGGGLDSLVRLGERYAFRNYPGMNRI